MGTTQADSQREASGLAQVLFGALVGLITTTAAIEFPPVGLPLVIAVVAAGLTHKFGSVWPPPALISSGLLVMVLGAATAIDCSKTDDFCGHTNVLPFEALGIALAIAGVVVAVRRLATARTPD
jgi:hypothetical protein